MYNISEEARQSIIAQSDKIIKGTPEGKLYKRVLAVNLLFTGKEKNEIINLLGIGRTTLELWAQKAAEHGVDDLEALKQEGRPSRLSFEQKREIDDALQKSPVEFGYDEVCWEGKLLSEYIAKKYRVTLCCRQCQRLMRELGYSMQRPQTVPYGANEADRELYKKP